MNVAFELYLIRSTFMVNQHKVDMLNSDNTTIRQSKKHSIDDDNQDVIWPTLVGIFVALALGWMMCRYKCSSKERSPHIVRCCPKSLCKRIRLFCTFIFSSCKCETESHQQRQHMTDSRLQSIKERTSNHSIVEIPFILNSSASRHASQQWPTPFLVNTTQGPTFPLSITIQPTISSVQPKRHPLRRESVLPDNDRLSCGQRESLPWPFQTTNMIFHKQTDEIKKNYLYIHT